MFNPLQRNSTHKNDSNYLAVPAPDFMYDTSNEVTEDIIVPRQKPDAKKSTGSIRSLREVIASQKGKTPPPARKERPKLNAASIRSTV